MKSMRERERVWLMQVAVMMCLCSLWIIFCGWIVCLALPCHAMPCYTTPHSHKIQCWFRLKHALEIRPHLFSMGKYEIANSNWIGCIDDNVGILVYVYTCGQIMWSVLVTVFGYFCVELMWEFIIVNILFTLSKLLRKTRIFPPPFTCIQMQCNMRL